MTVEYLAAGEDVRPRWRRPLAAAVLFLVVVAVAAAWWTGRVRQEANVVLSGAVEQADHQSRAGQAVVESMLRYASPMIWSTLVGGDVRAGLRKVVEGSAQEVVVTLERTRTAADGAFVLPWDGTQRQAKQEVLRLVDAHLARFQRIAKDATAIGAVLGEPEPSDAVAVDLLRASGVRVAESR
jgi:hypothetical protein